jgi:hypothetical protein
MYVSVTGRDNLRDLGIHGRITLNYLYAALLENIIDAQIDSLPFIKLKVH